MNKWAGHTAWKVRWELQGRPDYLPWDMLLTVPVSMLLDGIVFRTTTPPLPGGTRPVTVYVFRLGDEYGVDVEQLTPIQIRWLRRKVNIDTAVYKADVFLQMPGWRAARFRPLRSVLKQLHALLTGPDLAV